MLKEFVIEPDVLSDWRDFRYFIENIGIDKGRLLVSFPAKWRKYVIEIVKNNAKQLEFKRAEEMLNGISHAIVKAGRPYDGNMSWIDNSVKQNSNLPFHAVIFKSLLENAPSNFLNYQSIDHNQPLWNIEREKAIARNPMEISEFLTPLFNHAKTILFIDPYFRPSENRYRNAFRKYLPKIYSLHENPPEVEIFCKYPERERDQIPKDQWKSICNEALSDTIPNDTTVKITRCEQMEKKDGLHPRYVLTNRGGIRVDWGLDEGREGETTDVSLLAHSLYLRRWQDYKGPTSSFNHVDVITVHGTASV